MDRNMFIRAKPFSWWRFCSGEILCWTSHLNSLGSFIPGGYLYFFLMLLVIQSYTYSLFLWGLLAPPFFRQPFWTGPFADFLSYDLTWPWERVKHSLASEEYQCRRPLHALPPKPNLLFFPFRIPSLQLEKAFFGTSSVLYHPILENILSSFSYCSETPLLIFGVRRYPLPPNGWGEYGEHNMFPKKFFCKSFDHIRLLFPSLFLFLICMRDSVDQVSFHVKYCIDQKGFVLYVGNKYLSYLTSVKNKAGKIPF